LHSWYPFVSLSQGCSDASPLCSEAVPVKGCEEQK
jgi:hypothetical protein